MTALFCALQLQTATKALLDELGVPSSDTPEDRAERVYRSTSCHCAVHRAPHPVLFPVKSLVRLPQAVFCSRTLNFRAIQAIGYDLDYTLIHYGARLAARWGW